MIPAAFDYQRPTEPRRGARPAGRRRRTAKVMAGGQSLLPLLKLRLAAAERLVDIGGLAELQGDPRAARTAASASARWRPTPRCSTRELATSRVPLLALTIPGIGDVQVRNRGTLGGVDRPRRPGLRHAGRRARPRRRARAPVDARRAGRCRPTASSRARSRPTCADDELLTEIRIPARRADARMAYPATRAARVRLLDRRRRRRRRPDRRQIGHDRPDRHHRRRPTSPTAPRPWRPRWSARAATAEAIAAAAAHATDGITVELATSTPTRRTGRRWRGSYAPGDRGGARRRRLTLRAGAARADRPGPPPRPDLAGAVLTRDLVVDGERWAKGRRLAAADLDALARPGARVEGGPRRSTRPGSR